jgi:hypothetical protein
VSVGGDDSRMLRLMRSQRCCSEGQLLRKLVEGDGAGLWRLLAASDQMLTPRSCSVWL